MRTVNEKEPKLQDFGITPEEYALYIQRDTDHPLILIGFWLAAVVGFVAVFVVTFVVTQDLWLAVKLGFGAAVLAAFVTLGILGLVQSAIVGYKRSRLQKSPVASQIELYNKARSDYPYNKRKAQWEAMQAQWEERRAQERAEWARQNAERERLRKLRDYWMNLSGIEFERELAALFQRRGYRVQSTPSSGDQGIDLVARKNGKTTIVQCKRHKSPVGPAIARELYGSLIASRADRAILACTGGFTRGVKEFVKDKPITLIDAWDIIKVEASIQE